MYNWYNYPTILIIHFSLSGRNNFSMTSRGWLLMLLFAILMSSITGIENYFRIKWNAMRCLKKIFEGILNVILNLWNENYDASNTFKFPRFHLDAMYFPFMKYTLKSLLYTQNYCQCVQESQKVFSNTLDVFFAQMEVKQYKFEVRFKKHPGFDNFCDIKKSCLKYSCILAWHLIANSRYKL